MTAVSCSSSPLSSSCDSSSMPERGRTSGNIKADFSRASLATSLASSATKRKRMSSLSTATHDSSSAGAQQNNMMIEDDTVFDLTPRRRFKRRNSKCASMFFQMISPTTLLELQKIAGEAQEPGYERMAVPSMHRDQRRAGEEDEEQGNRWSCTQLRRQMPATLCPTYPCSLSAFSAASTPSTTTTHSILAEALRLSSSHLDEMASELLVHNNSEESQLADSDVESVESL